MRAALSVPEADPGCERSGRGRVVHGGGRRSVLVQSWRAVAGALKAQGSGSKLATCDGLSAVLARTRGAGLVAILAAHLLLLLLLLLALYWPADDANPTNRTNHSNPEFRERGVAAGSTGLGSLGPGELMANSINSITVRNERAHVLPPVGAPPH